MDGKKHMKTPRKSPRRLSFKEPTHIQLARHVSSSSQKSIKFILPPKRPKDTVIVLCTDLSNKAYARHVVDAAKALDIYGYNVILVTNTYKPYRSLKKIKIVEVGTWLPRSFLGYFRNLCYILRSAYVAYWLSVCGPHNPTMVFCEAHKIVLPILNWGEFKVAYFQYLYGDVNQGKIKQVSIKSSWLSRLCLPFANAVLVPSKQYKEIFEKAYKDLHFNPIIMYPYIHTRSLEKATFEDLYKKQIVPGECYNTANTIFLVIGEYLDRSNFELAVKAFEYLMTVVDKIIKPTIYLIVAGYNSTFTKSNLAYYEKIKKMVKMSRCSKHCVLLRKTSMAEKKTLIELSSALVHTPADEIYNKNILEAMSMGKPVIATNSGYMKEIIQNEVTGFLVDQDCCLFASAMNNFVNKPRITKMMGSLAKVEFLRRYSLMSFGARLRKLIRNNCAFGVTPTIPKEYFIRHVMNKKIPEVEKCRKKKKGKWIKNVNSPPTPTHSRVFKE